MRFTIEEINNRTDLLPGITLGYRIFDYCSDIGSLPSAVDLIACGEGDSVRLGANQSCLPNVVSVSGSIGSTEAITVSQVILSNMLPVVNHGASSVQLSHRQKFPSFFRTVPSDKFQVQAIIHLLKEFRWNWVAFVGNNKDYTLDALEVFHDEIESADICLAYQGFISDTDDGAANDKVLNMIQQQKIEVVVVVGHEGPVKAFLKKAVQRNVRKIWIGSEAWSTSTLDLIEESDIDRLGTVLGVTLHQKTEFNRRPVGSSPPQSSRGSCGQICEKCGELTAKDVNSLESTFSFSTYSAMYAVAHALHKTLSCNQTSCTKSSVEPYMMVKALKNITFTLYNQSIEFDENGDPPAIYDVVFWNWTSKTIDTVGSYNSMLEPSFSLDQDLIHWHSGKDPPILRCSADCNPGQQKKQTSFHSCCFDCVNCTAGTFINHTTKNKCIRCQKHEWSGNGSTSCQERREVYPHFDDPLAILLILATAVTILLCGGTLTLFVRHFDSPVVKSAGRKMSLLVLGFLVLSCVSVFLLLGQPSHVKCKLCAPIFLVFYTATLACLAVRSFQIVCVFKMAAKLPKAFDFWVKHGGRWVIVAICFVVQVVLSTLWMWIDGPVPIERYTEEEIVFTCTYGQHGLLFAMFTVISLISLVCFAFSYMGMDLPKNYNEGKAITFCLFIFYVSWTLFLTLYFIVSQNGNYTLIMMAMGSSMLSSIFGVLLGYFGPKCFIIIFRPERNTATYFQAAIQTYNMQIRR
ncbi:taste receptor type 1 member 1-like [Engraulis encrasicolus]|uniref:taste receptor type 1 member 1-like n=1 Tax=Engraulis encrasicolus TaxID=184585 RepID=UPI002FCFC089